MIFTLFYLVSVVYCLYKLAKRGNDRDMGGNIGATPALDTMMVVLLAPFLAVMDLGISAINFLKRTL